VLSPPPEEDLYGDGNLEEDEGSGDDLLGDGMEK
jgi:hypothetical protein